MRLGLVLLLALGFAACSRDGPAEKSGTAAAVVVEGRRIDIRAGEGGYEPSRVTARAGEQVTLVFTRTVESECLSQITVPSLGIKKALPLRQPVAIPLHVDRSGEVMFACGMDMVHGLITFE